MDDIPQGMVPFVEPEFHHVPAGHHWPREQAEPSRLCLFRSGVRSGTSLPMDDRLGMMTLPNQHRQGAVNVAPLVDDRFGRVMVMLVIVLMVAFLVIFLMVFLVRGRVVLPVLGPAVIVGKGVAGQGREKQENQCSQQKSDAFHMRLAD